MSEVSQAALEAAMKAAVACGMIPKHADEATYLRNWEGMKAVLAAAQAADPLFRAAPASFFGMKFVIDETLPPNTIELRGANTVRMTNIGPEST